MVNKPDLYSIPHNHDITAIIQDNSAFAKVDLTRAYHQSPIVPHYISKTGITRPFAFLEFFHVPYGLINAVQPFQRFIDYVSHRLHFACVYMDDVLMASSAMEEHIKHLQLVLKHFEKFGVAISPVKWEFAKLPVIFLKYFIKFAGIPSSPSKVEAIINFPVADTMWKLKQFL